MKHFWRDIPGWCDFTDLYAEQVKRVPAGGHLVEVGTFLGKSAAFLAVEAARAFKPLAIDLIDTWQGVSREEGGDEFWAIQEDAIAAHGSLEAACRANLAPVADRVTLINAHSLVAVQRYHDASLDFVFLDDDHSGPHVYQELEAWWPKVKPGGVIAGHDFNWPDVKKAVGWWAKRRGCVAQPVSGSSWAIEKPVVSDVWTRLAGQRRCLVAVACAERTIGRDTAQSLVELAWNKPTPGRPEAHGFSAIDFGWFFMNVRVDALRDQALQHALAHDYSHVLFLDADMVWPSDVISKMLAHHHRGITSGLYFLKKWPHSPVAMHTPVWDELKQAFNYTYDDEGVDADVLRRVEIVGMGCTLIPTVLAQRLPRPWFKYQEDSTGYPNISEDVWFCQQATKAGCTIWLDPTIQCRHDSHELIGFEHWLRSQTERRMVAAIRQQKGQSIELADAGV